MTSLSRRFAGTFSRAPDLARHSRPHNDTPHSVRSVVLCLPSQGAAHSARKGTRKVVTCHTRKRRPPAQSSHTTWRSCLERAFGPQSHGMHASTIGRVYPAHGSHRRCRSPSHLLHCTCSGRCLSRVCLRSEDDVCRRDVSPYGCEDVISCLSTRQSRQRRSLTPWSARVW